MAGARPQAGLAHQYARWLAALFIAVELVTVAAAFAFVLLPLARRAADDLAGLMVLSATTWSQLPPPARAAFRNDLAASHGLALWPGMPAPPPAPLGHGLYVHLLDAALEARLGQPVHFRAEADARGEEWLWTSVAVPGREPMGVGFAVSRLRAHPVRALAVALSVGVLLVSLLSWRLARRIAQPVAALEHAAEQVAQGQSPALLPETGPRELARLARHFNRMARQVRELLEARTVLFAGVSHDLRTPLARMRLAIEMLTLKPSPVLLQRLEHDIEEMNALIGQMLELAREFGTEPARRLDLCPWLKSRVQAHAVAAVEAGAVIELHCEGECLVHVAPGMLARVVDNLLGNALRHAAGPIRVAAQPLSEGEAARVRIGVLDRGPGIPAHQLARVFRPFERGASAGSGAPGSYGLGLAIVQQLCQANGWSVSVAPRAGGGLEAWVTVPAAR